MLNAMVWIAQSGAPWRDLPERYGSWESVYSRFRSWVKQGILENIFRTLSLDAELAEISLDGSIVQAHQHSAGASTKIHAAVDAYGYPVYFMFSEGQRNDINFAIPVLEHINIK